MTLQKVTCTNSS